MSARPAVHPAHALAMRMLEQLAFAAIYVAAAELGLQFAFLGRNVSPIWSAAGLAVAGIVLSAGRCWPAIFVGSLVANWLTGIPHWLAVALAVASTLEALTAYALLRRVRGFDPSLQRLRDVLALVGCAAVAPLVAATVGVTALWQAGAVPPGRLPAVVFVYWVGDAVRILVVGGGLLAWLAKGYPRPRGAALAELLALTAVIVGVSGATFSNILPSDILIVPLLVWAAFRFGIHGATLSAAAVAVMAVTLTARGVGPFAAGPQLERIEHLMLHLVVVTGTVLVLAALLAERRAAAATLRDSNERYRALIEAAPLAIIAVDRHGAIERWNPTAERIFGYPAAEAVGRILPVVPEERQPEFAGFLARGLAGESIHGHETRRRRRDGTLVEVSLSTAPLTDAAGHVTGLLGLIEDIGARKAAEGALRQSESELSAVLAAMTDLVFVLSAEGVYLKVVEKAGGPFYQPPHRLLGRRVHDIFPPAQADLFVAMIRDALATGKPVEREYPLEIEGRERWFSGTTSPMTATAAVFVARDVTERKRLELQLIQSQRMEAVGRLAGGVAHDFNNLLTTVLAMSELLLLELPPDDPHRPDVEAIRHAGRRAALLTRQLLAFGRKQAYEPRDLDLNEVVLAVTGTLGRIIGKDVELVTAVADGLPPVHADPVHVEQLLLNLAVNARDAMPEGGRLEITTAVATLDAGDLSEWPDARPGRFVRLGIGDTGDGIDAETLPHIFEPFFTTREVGKGSGLGLATVYGIVQQSRGCMTVESRPGAGARFDIYWPVAAGGADDLTAPPAVPNLQLAARGIPSA